MKKATIFVMLLLVSSIAFAHIPYVKISDSAKERIDSPMEKSVAFYMSFEKPGDVDMLYFRLHDDDFELGKTLTGLEGEEELIVTDDNGVTGRLLHVGSLVPGCDVYSDILPVIAIVGPIQEYLTSYTGSMPLPFNVDQDEGVYIVQNSAQGPLWYEKYTYKSYYDQKKTDIVLTREGEYRIYVWEPSELTGDYVVEVGKIEVFGLPEIFKTLFWVEHIINDGEISSQECKDQLEVRDGPNPSLPQVIADYKKMFNSPECGPLPDCSWSVPGPSDSGCATQPGGGTLFPLLALLVLARWAIRWRARR